LILFEIAALILLWVLRFSSSAKRNEKQGMGFCNARQAIRDVVASKDRARAKEVAHEEVGVRYCFDLDLMDCRVCALDSAASNGSRSTSQS